MIVLISFFILVALIASAVIRLIAALFSKSIRNSVVRHPIAHSILFLGGLTAFLILFFIWFLPMTKLRVAESISADTQHETNKASHSP